ncbi:MAG: leucine-rich repeat protein [Oscillospiraceae bacterium]|nr:leucine-rich repeat protein [Oscillospiraceae bacterium]
MLFTKTKKRFISAVLTMAMVVGIIMVIPVFANEDNTTTFVYDGYRIDYTIDRVDGDVQDITVTITNTGADVIEDWELVYDDFGGVVEDIQGAEIVLNEHGIILEEMLFENAHKPMTVEMLENFKMEYYSELVNVESINDNSTILPSESVTFSYILSDFTDIPEFIGFEEDKVIDEDNNIVDDEEDIDDYDFLSTLSIGNNLPSLSLGGSLVGSGGISTTNSADPTGGICACCGNWSFTVEGSGNNKTVVIYSNLKIMEVNIPIAIVANSMFVPFFGSLPMTVTKISNNAKFHTNITSVTIPNTITHIGNESFSGKPLLKTLTFKRATPPTFGLNVFQGTNNITKINVPFGSIGNYRNVSQFSNAQKDKIRGYCINHSSDRVCSCKFRLGDVDGNGIINSLDASEILQYAVKLDSVIATTSGTIKNYNSLNAAIITSASWSRNPPRPDVNDSNEIYKYLAGQSGVLKSLYG